MKKIVFSVGIFLVFSGPAFAQQTLVGKYSGSFVQTTNRGDVTAGLTLEVLAVEGDTVKGKAARASVGNRDGCAGEFTVEGKVKGNELELKSTASSVGAGDCSMALRLTVDGNKLVGTMNQSRAQLSR